MHHLSQCILSGVLNRRVTFVFQNQKWLKKWFFQETRLTECFKFEEFSMWRNVSEQKAGQTDNFSRLSPELSPIKSCIHSPLRYVCFKFAVQPKDWMRICIWCLKPLPYLAMAYFFCSSSSVFFSSFIYQLIRFKSKFQTLDIIWHPTQQTSNKYIFDGPLSGKTLSKTKPYVKPWRHWWWHKRGGLVSVVRKVIMPNHCMHWSFLTFFSMFREQVWKGCMRIQIQLNK